MSHHHEHHGNHEHHDHHEHHHESRQQLLLIAATALLLVAAIFVEHTFQLSTWQLLLVYLVPYLLVGHETLKEAAEGLAHGEAFNEHFLMSIATLGALGIGFMPGAEHEFPEAVFVMLFFQVGEFFESYAEGKSKESISHLMDIRPDIATICVSDNNGGFVEQQVSPDRVQPDSVIVVRPGEKVPLDGTIIEGVSTLNMSALTGESVPYDVNPGDSIISGSVNISGLLKIRTTKSFGESTVSKIIRLVESAGEKKSQSEAFITRFARIYTPIVVFAAIAIALLPPVFSFFFLHVPFSASIATWLYRALMFLIVSCPCALVISVPLTFFSGIGGASRRGILIKGANYIDVLAKVRTVVFDKTGTLTHGLFSVLAVHPDMLNENELLHLAAHVEHYSTHPIGAALRDAFPEEATDGCEVQDIEEIAGKGIRAQVEGRKVSVGNTKLMDAEGVEWKDCTHKGTIIHVAVDGVYAGHIVIGDQVKEDSAEAIERLRKLGIENTVILTGDRKEAADAVARQLGVKACYSELLPGDKVEHVERLLNEKEAGTFLAFVGDGINDAPVLTRADVGVAMGGLGSDAAVEAADVVIMDDKPTKIALAIRIAHQTIGIARQNVAFAIGVKTAVLVLASFGLSTMAMAVFADVGVTVLAVLNAMRALKTK